MTDGTEAILARLAELEQRQRDQADVLASMSDLGGQVHQVSELLADLTMKVGLDSEDDTPGRMPRPTPQWHKLTKDELDAELHKLRGFVREFGPLYGHLLKIGDCWPRHPLACIAIEIWGEYHQLLFTGDRRKPSILAGQVDALIRAVPGLLGVAAKETVGCSKHDPALNGIKVSGGAS